MAFKTAPACLYIKNFIFRLLPQYGKFTRILYFFAMQNQPFEPPHGRHLKTNPPHSHSHEILALKRRKTARPFGPAVFNMVGKAFWLLGSQAPLARSLCQNTCQQIYRQCFGEPTQ
ncbi:MAG: hypothetical protein ACK5L3_01315 [Oscillospiraceae bacterium]